MDEENNVESIESLKAKLEAETTEKEKALRIAEDQRKRAEILESEKKSRATQTEAEQEDPRAVLSGFVSEDLKGKGIDLDSLKTLTRDTKFNEGLSKIKVNDPKLAEQLENVDPEVIKSLWANANGSMTVEDTARLVANAQKPQSKESLKIPPASSGKDGSTDYNNDEVDDYLKQRYGK